MGGAGRVAWGHRVRHVLWLLGGALLAYLAYQSHLIVAVVPVLVLVGVGSLVSAGYHAWRRTRPDARRKALSRLLACGYCAALSLLILSGHASLQAASKREMLVAVDAIERYRAQVGGYPRDLAGLMPTYVERLPVCKGTPLDRMLYVLREPPGSYALTCYTFFAAKLTFDSATRGWRVWD